MSILAPLWSSRIHRLLLPLLMAGSLVPIWSSEYFPSQNGPWHLLTIQMLHEYSNPAFNYADFYVPSFHAIPHLAHTLTVYLLAFVLPLLVAHKVAISLYALLLPVSVFWFVATVNRRRVAFAYVSFLLIYNVPLFRGYHDYALGLPLAFLTLTYWLRHRDSMTASHTLVTMLLIVCVYLSHLFNFLVLGLAMLVYTLHRDRSARTFGRLAVLFLPASLLLAEFVVFSVRQTRWMDTSELTFLGPVSAVGGFFENFFHTLSTPGYFVTLAAFVLGAPLVLVSLIETYRSSGRTVRQALVANPALTLMLLCLALYFVTPFKLFGWHFVNARFVPYVIVFAVAGLTVSSVVARRAAVFVAIFAAVALYGSLAVEVRHTGDLLDEYLSAMDKVRRNSVMLPVAVESADVGTIAPLAHAYDYYPLFRGGANGKGIAQFNTVTPIVYRTYPTKDRFPLPGADNDLRGVSRAYDYVLLWGADLYPVMLLRKAGFELVHEQGNLRMFENPARVPRRKADAR
jgi:hypothetical protein